MLYGVGIQDIKISAAERKMPIYCSWRNMIRRCYDPDFLIENPSYTGCSVVPEWHSYSGFKAWAMTQDYENKQLDKDLLVKGNKVYGPHTCLYVSKEINNLFGNKLGKGGNPPGVTQRKYGRWHAKIKIEQQCVHIGYFSTAAEASEAYRVTKNKHIVELANKTSCPKLKQALLNAQM